MKSSPKWRTIVHVTIIALVCVTVYANSLHVPFQWDDKYMFLSENPIIKDLRYFLDPSSAKGFIQHGALVNRYASYLTFALNYRMGGLNVEGYHIVNITIHLLNALLLYAILRMTLDRSRLSPHAGTIALLSALIFTAHPLMTEAVTYVFQRLVSLATLFSLGGLAAYIYAVRRGRTPMGYAVYLAGIISLCIAMKSKEIAITVPPMIALYDILFHDGPIKARIQRLLPVLATTLIVPVSLLGSVSLAGLLSGGTGAEVADGVVPRTQYLFTEFTVIVRYLRLLIFPTGQNLYYDYPASTSFFDLNVIASFSVLALIFTCALILIARTKRTNVEARLAGFGLIWFFTALSLESSIIPIQGQPIALGYPSYINEYRAYMPSAGIISSFVILAFMLADRWKFIRLLIAALGIATIALGAVTIQRNTVWGTETGLWEDISRKSPKLFTARNNLGLAYLQKDMTDKAIEQLTAAIIIEPNYHYAYNNLGNAYKKKGLAYKAISQYRTAIQIKPDYAEAHFNLGTALLDSGEPQKARAAFAEAYRLDPSMFQAKWFLDFIDSAGPSASATGTLAIQGATPPKGK